MLGVALTAQRAGWASGDPTFTSTSSVGISAYNGYSNLLSFTPNLWQSPRLGDNLGSTFDNAGIVSANRAMYVATIKVAAQSNFTWTDDTFRSDYQYLNSGGQQYPWRILATRESDNLNSILDLKFGRKKTTHELAFLTNFGTYEYFNFAGTWDSFSDTWITVLWSGSATKTDFANWTGQTGTWDFYTRTTIINARTGQLIETKDYAVMQFNSLITDYAAYTWDYNDGAGGAGTAYVNSLIGDNPAGSSNLLYGAGWCCYGQMLDPTATDANGRPWYQYWLGQNFPKTVNSIDAWINWSAEDVVTNGSNQEVSLMLPARVTTTNNLYSIQATAGRTTPYTNSSRPGD